jgi:hypothetical protein
MSFKRLAVLWPNGIRIVAKLAYSEKCPTIFIVTESGFLVH